MCINGFEENMEYDLVGNGMYDIVRSYIITNYNMNAIRTGRNDYESLNKDLSLLNSIGRYNNTDVVSMSATDINIIRNAINEFSNNIDKDFIIDVISFGCAPIKKYLKGDN